MAMKLDLPKSNNNKVAVWINCLALILLLLLAYIFLFKRYDVPRKASLDNQRIVVSTLKKNIVTPSNSPTHAASQQTNAALPAKIIDDGRPIIALVIGELGVSKSNIELGLPAEVTFGFSAYLDIANNYSNHQLLLNIPLQSVDYPNDDPGPNALLLKNSESENLDRLNIVLNKKINYQGVYTSADEDYTASEKDAEFLLANLKERNLIYLCGILDKNNLIYQLAKKIDFHILANDVILDEVISSEAINDKLMELENIAREQGSAIAIGSSYPLTIELLKQWIPSLKAKDIRILPIKDFYQITEMRKALLSEVRPKAIK